MDLMLLFTQNVVTTNGFISVKPSELLRIISLYLEGQNICNFLLPVPKGNLQETESQKVDSYNNKLLGIILIILQALFSHVGTWKEYGCY